MNFDEFLLKFGDVVFFESSQHVFRQGEPEPNLYFVANGLLKAYYVTVDGKEFVKSFIMENDLIGSLNSAFMKETCSFNLVCMERCELVKIDFENLKKTATQDLEVADTLIGFLIKLAMKKEKREYEFLCMKPEERYQKIRKENPGLLNRVTQNDIARYLGITPVALSRIRNRIVK